MLLLKTYINPYHCKICNLLVNIIESFFLEIHSYSFNRAALDQKATAGTIVARPYAKDADLGKNAEIIYKIQPLSELSKYFEIEKSTGVVTLSSPFYVPESMQNFDIQIVAKDQGSPSLETNAIISINVTDSSNALKPYSDLNITFLVPGFEPLIAEDTKIGSIIAIIKPIDPKSIISNISLIMDGDGTFKINTGAQNHSYLTLKRELDRESRDNYSLLIGWNDQTSSKLKTTLVPLAISDVNDNVPEFSQQIYEANVQENAAHATSVIKITAKDADQGDNARVRYSMTSSSKNDVTNDDDDWLEIDSDTGLVSTKAGAKNSMAPNCEANSRMEYTVSATDFGAEPKSSQAKLILNVIGVNDNVPVFDRPVYNVTVKEDAAVGTCVVQVNFVCLSIFPNYGKKFEIYRQISG